MPMTLDELETEALKLSLDDRVHLADRLWISADPTPEAEIAKLWTAEAERRLEELRTGKVKSIPGDLVMARVRARLR